MRPNVFTILVILVMMGTASLVPVQHYRQADIDKSATARSRTLL
jgi:hypothetical protein